MDNYYLNLAVYLLEDFLKSTEHPQSEAVFEYGRPMKPHGWQPFTNVELVRMMAGGNELVQLQHELESMSAEPKA